MFECERFYFFLSNFAKKNSARHVRHTQITSQAAAFAPLICGKNQLNTYLFSFYFACAMFCHSLDVAVIFQSAAPYFITLWEYFLFFIATKTNGWFSKNITSKLWSRFSIQKYYFMTYQQYTDYIYIYFTNGTQTRASVDWLNRRNISIF